MKKYLLFFVAALATVVSCQNDPAPEVVAPRNVSGQATDNTPEKISIITAVDSLDNTKTYFDNANLQILWKENDKIGVFLTDSKNASFTVNPEDKDKKVAAFSSDGAVTGDPQYCYHPYSSTAGTDATAVALTLAPVQTQTTINVPNIGANDFRIGQITFDGSKYNTTMQQKTAVLYYKFKPTAPLNGDKLDNITLKVNGRKLTGNFTMDITNMKSAPVFASNAADSVKLVFADKPTLVTDTQVEGWAVINPSIKAGDVMDFVIETDNHLVDVHVTINKDFAEGYRYGLPLDVASLAGKAVISQNTKFNLIQTPGVYNVTDINDPSVKLAYTPGASQYTYAANRFSIQSMSLGYAVVDSLRSTPTTVGESYKMGVKAIGTDKVTGSAGTDFDVKLTRIQGNKRWLVDETNNVGYIIIQ